ncbi:MAG: ABC transporter permease [Coriobacteriia bacterium]|nr:ABC transporter permease [Coriobacteriia bacterium]MCL2750602.1 ABC transporter permease [Coriobacteriia bacterium]
MHRRLLGYALALFIILLSWHVLSLIVNSPALPTPLQTVPMLVTYGAQLGPDFLVSFYRVLIAMIIGTAIAMPLGLAIGRSPRLDTVFGPLLYILYPIPKIVFLPILLVLLGIADAPKIVLIALTIFFQVLITVRDAAKEVPEASVLSIRSLGASRMDVFLHVVIPASLPALFTALRISSGTAVAILFFAEAIAGSTGLGHFIIDSWAMLSYPRMFAGIIAMAFLGVILYEIFDILERRLARWR